jgi:hypothetical protein
MTNAVMHERCTNSRVHTCTFSTCHLRVLWYIDRIHNIIQLKMFGKDKIQLLNTHNSSQLINNLLTESEGYTRKYQTEVLLY